MRHQQKYAIVVQYRDGIRSIQKLPVRDEPKLDFYYHQIKCDVFDLVMFPDFMVYCDDEGLLKNDPTIIQYPEKVLAGNLVIAAGVGEDGDTLFFTHDDPNMEKAIDWARMGININACVE